jgi:hypothetical protein
LIAAYAVRSSWGEASSIETLLQGVRDGGVTFVHVFPPSAVRWTSPSSVPAQITFASLYPGASV